MITLLDVDQFIKEYKIQGPVESPQIFSGVSYSFHNKGLMSEDIFGMEGTTERTDSYSWINLNCQVIHPVLYEILLKRIERTLPRLLSGESSFNISEDGTLIELPEGEIGELNGMSDFIKNITKIKFRNPEEGDRGKIIDVLYKNVQENLFFINKLIVISPTYRNVEITDDLITGKKKITVNELTKYYKRIIELSLQIKSVSGTIKDVLSYKLQELIYEMYQYIKTKISKKTGIIRRMILGKRMDFSARSVIAPDATLNIGEVGVPLKICLSLFEPFMIYGIMNSPYSKNIPDEFFTEVKKYLGKEEIDIEDLEIQPDSPEFAVAESFYLNENYFTDSIKNIFLLTKNSILNIHQFFNRTKTDIAKYQEFKNIQNEYNQILNQYQLSKKNNELDKYYNQFVNNLGDLQVRLNKLNDTKTEIGKKEVESKFYDSVSSSKTTKQSSSIKSETLNLTDFYDYMEKSSRKVWNKHWKKFCNQSNKRALNRCKAHGVERAISYVKSKASSCNKYSNKEDCLNSINRLIEYWKQRKTKYLK